VTLLGVLLHAKARFVLVPILCGSLLLVLIAVIFHRLQGSELAYPHHWI
jgi:CBS-domain-containing membrane protein